MKDTRHLGVYGVIINNDEILLVRKKRGAYTGKLDLPGGSIEHGETPIETLKRELMEETNSIVKNATIFDADSVLVEWSHDDTKENMHHIGIIYKVEIEDNINVKMDPDGLDSLGSSWYKIKDINKDMVSPLTYRALVKMKYKNN